MLILGMSACLGPTELPITLTDAQWGTYWQELEWRWPAFFKSQCVAPPALPRMNDVRTHVTLVEVSNEWMTAHGVYCTYNRASRKIRVAESQWACIPHELGHAACHVIGGKVCIDYEHREYKSRC